MEVARSFALTKKDKTGAMTFVRTLNNQGALVAMVREQEVLTDQVMDVHEVTKGGFQPSPSDVQVQR